MRGATISRVAFVAILLASVSTARADTSSPLEPDPATKPYRWLYGFRLSYDRVPPSESVVDNGARFASNGDGGAGFGILGVGGVRWSRFAAIGSGGFILHAHDAGFAQPQRTGENFAVIALGLSAGVAVWIVRDVHVGVRGVLDVGSGGPDASDENGPTVYSDVDGGRYTARGAVGEIVYAHCFQPLGNECPKGTIGIGVSAGKMWFEGQAKYGQSTSYTTEGAGTTVSVFVQMMMMR